jgi:DNA-binding protein HU-beta|tara:strand:+ start:975 stop:1367 length:393 start_codon:yes stop_codon:yes gene_type:complete
MFLANKLYIVLISLISTKKNVDFPYIYDKSTKKHKKEAKMNKKQLIGKISASMNLSKADAERTFDGITEIILSCLKGDEQVKIAGFGTYKVAKRKARVGRNPRTGEQIQIAASQKVKFLPAKALKEMFNK